MHNQRPAKMNNKTLNTVEKTNPIQKGWIFLYPLGYASLALGGVFLF